MGVKRRPTRKGKNSEQRKAEKSASNRDDVSRLKARKVDPFRCTSVLSVNNPSISSLPASRGYYYYYYFSHIKQLLIHFFLKKNTHTKSSNQPAPINFKQLNQKF